MLRNNLLVATLAALCCLPLASATAADATSASDATADARPGATGEASIPQWTRVGALGETPERTTDAFPLSDQNNESGWVYDQKHSDEFNGESLDQQRWSSRHRSWRGREPALFSSKNVNLKDGKLQLWMRKDGGAPSGPRDRFHTWTSASVQARELTRYGYYEVRAKPMNSAGSSSFWFAHNENGWRTEIDVFELGGKAIGHERRYNMNLHVFYTPTERRHWNVGDKWIAPFRWADDFHTFGLEWTPERLTYYVDGVAVRWVANTYWRQPLYTIFDSETMIDWLGEPQDEDLPSVYEIDYYRVWRKPTPSDGEQAPLGQKKQLKKQKANAAS